MFLEKAKKSLRFSFLFSAILVFYSPIWGADDDGHLHFITAEQVKLYPHNNVLSVLSSFGGYFGGESDTYQKGGSAFLIGNNFALTSAHVVYNKSKGDFANEVYCYINRHGDEENGEGMVVQVTNYILPIEYVDYVKPENRDGWRTRMDHDYALLYFAEEIQKDGRFIRPEPSKPTLAPPQLLFKFCGYPGAPQPRRCAVRNVK